MIEVKDLTKDYGNRRAINHLNFKVEKGDVVGFLGPNGAGKSTTMKIITGFMAPTSGSALVAGYDVFSEPLEVKKRIGYLPETPPVYGEMYVEEYLQYVGKLKKLESSAIQKGVNDAIEKTNLGEVRGRLIQHLSKGFRQRVGIAQALVSDPEVLILDEPTVGLDPKQVAEIRELIQGLKGQHTIILSTHILPEVQATCEKIIIINKGEIVAQDSIHQLELMEQGKTKIKVRLLQGNAGVAALKSDISGVLAVEAGATDKDWFLEVKSEDTVISEVSKWLVQKNLGIVEFSPTKQDLEDVFLKLTYGKGE
ncbi:MAG: ABC transporter ATP-binding protein [Bdellovibrionia bacterium]